MVEYISGDIFEGESNIIVHQVNCQGVMGSGIALAIKTFYPEVYKQYLGFLQNHYLNEHKTPLGKIQLVRVDDGRIKMVCNFFSQDDYGYDGIFTDYGAFESCLEILRDYLTENKYAGSVGFPYKIGCNRGGGDWKIVSRMIEDILKDFDVKIYVYKEG